MSRRLSRILYMLAEHLPAALCCRPSPLLGFRKGLVFADEFPLCAESSHPPDCHFRI